MGADKNKVVGDDFGFSRRGFLLLPSQVTAGTGTAAAVARWATRLYTATQIQKIADTYFIVDCWHHRVIYSRNLSAPIADWQILDANLAGPHSIASDLSLHVVDVSGRHGLNVYAQGGRGFELVQQLSNVGRRPHRVVYEPSLGLFFVIGSMDQRLQAYKNKGGRLELVISRAIPELKGQYTRSLTIHDGMLYLVGNRSIVALGLRALRLNYAHEIRLASAYQGANDLFFMSAHSGLLTTTPRKAFVFKTLSDLGSGHAADVSSEFVGTPYYVEKFDGRLWIPEITEHTRIASYAILNGSIDFSRRDLRFDFGPPDASSLERKQSRPL